MLYIWTTNTKPYLFDKTCKDPLRANPHPHKFIVWKEGDTIPPLQKGELGLLLGGGLLKEFQKAGLLKKGRTINSLRGVPHKFGDGEFFVSFDPAMYEVSVEYTMELQWDVALALRYANTGSLNPPLGSYLQVENFDELIGLVEKKYSEKPVPVALTFDSETVGSDPRAPNGRILSISFTVEEGKSYVYVVPESGKIPDKIKDQLQFLLTSPKIKTQGANLKYDILWLFHQWKIWVSNQKFDTYLAGSLLDENRSNSLKFHAKQVTPMGGYSDEFDRKHDKSRMDLVPKEELITYNGADTDACHRVANVFRRQMTEDKLLANFYVNLLQPSSLVFAKMEHRGVVVDVNRYKELEKECRAELATYEKEALKFIPNRILAKYADNCTLSRSAIIKEFMFTERGLNLTPLVVTEKTNEASTSMKHLKQFANHPDAGPFIKALKNYAVTSKTLSTYIIGFQSHLRSDGRFHPSYRMGVGGGEDEGEDGGTNTGRTSAKDPAYQTITKRGLWAKRLRTVYVCPPGYVILKFDFSQGELRIVACVAHEPTMLKAYKEDFDLHAITASILKKMSLEDFLKLPAEEIELARYGGKAGNFGLVYGMQVDGFLTYAEDTYGVRLSQKDGEDFRNGFFKTYYRLPEWHEETKRLASNQGYIRNPLGRIRHLPLINSRDRSARSKAERQSLNAPIQSCLSDIMQLTMVELDRRWPDLWMFGMTHDSLEMYVPEDEYELWAKRCKETAENLSFEKFGWKPQIPFVVDLEWSSTNLAEAKKLKIKT